MYRLFLLVFASILLASCQVFPKKSQPSPSPIPQGEPSAEEVLKGDSLLALVIDNTLSIVDPDFGIFAPLYTLLPDEIPPLLQLSTFKLSPTKNYIAWYSPSKGLLVYNILLRKTSVLEPPSTWFNTHPYFDFHSTQDIVYFMSNEGNVFHGHNLALDQDTPSSIPYPFGTLFAVSPDGSHVIFISGYQQNAQPEYLMLNLLDGTFTRFLTEGELSQRQLLTWLPDSSGVVMPLNDALMLHRVANPTSSELFFTIPMEHAVIDLYTKEGLLFVYTEGDSWHVIDPQTKKEHARVPQTIAQELYQPQFIPWTRTQFLIEETLSNPPEISKRLWLSDLKGIKKMVVKKYYTRTTEVETPTF